MFEIRLTMSLSFQLSRSYTSYPLISHLKSNPTLSPRLSDSLSFGHISPPRFNSDIKCSMSRKQEIVINAENRNLKEKTSWIDLYLPKVARPYARLARLDTLIGIWLHGAPYFWSIALAAPLGQLPDIGMLGRFVIPIFLLKCITCAFNDIHDRDIDKKVERSKGRPLASGDLSLPQAICFLAIQFVMLLGYGLLVPFNNYSRFLMALSLPLHFAYPLMKRITYWPQAYLGFTYNLGALVGWAAVKGSLQDPLVVFPLYISTILWTLAYDTIYAHQDVKDDAKAGVKSTAVLFGDSTRRWISVFGVGCIASLALAGFNAQLGWPFYAFLVAASAHLAWQIGTVDLSNPKDCSQKFLSTKWIGAIVLAGIVFGRLGSIA